MSWLHGWETGKVQSVHWKLMVEEEKEQYTLYIMTSQDLMPARNAGLSSHRPGKLNNSKWPLSKFSRAMKTKTSIPRGHEAFRRHA